MRHPHNERTFNPASVQKLEDPERLLWLPPAEVVALLDLRRGMTVADIGAGTGYFSLPIAEAVAPSGAVKAVDFQPEMLALLQSKLAASTPSAPIVLVEGSADNTTLPDGCCDLVLLAKVWHELDARGEILAEMRRILRPVGRIAILEWRTDVSRPPGPPFDHRVPPESVRSELAAARWSGAGTHMVGPYSYLILAGRPD